MVVAAVDAAAGIARCVDAGGEGGDVDLGLVEPSRVTVGARLIVHAGTAIALAAGGAAGGASDEVAA